MECGICNAIKKWFKKKDDKGDKDDKDDKDDRWFNAELSLTIRKKSKILRNYLMYMVLPFHHHF